MKKLSYVSFDYVEHIKDLAIFNIQSKRYLAFVLKTQLPLLKDISRNPNNFYRFKVKEIVKNENIQHKLNAKVIVVLIILFFINPPFLSYSTILFLTCKYLCNNSLIFLISKIRTTRPTGGLL